jgi:hypothetical protein
VLLLAGGLSLPARAIYGGVEVGDDIGARATVILRVGDIQCTGAVYGDSFILTAAHCLIDDDGEPHVAASRIKITYAGKPDQVDAPTRTAAQFVAHESFVRQVRAAGASDKRPTDQDDIAVIRVADGHPAGAVGVTLPEIDNDYVFRGYPRSRTIPRMWVDVYGYGPPAPSEPNALRKVRLAGTAPDLVRTSLSFDVPYYFPRRILMSPNFDEFGNDPAWNRRGICEGDSGGPAFLVTSSWFSKPRDGALKLIDGRPLLVGLSSLGFQRDGDDEMLGDACVNTFTLVRTDFYRDWILSTIRQMQRVAP